MTDYLIILGVYISSEYEKELSIEILTSLKEEGIDVCVVTHTTKYLEELSQYAKFVMYDSNNERISANDYYKNADVLDDSNTQYKDSFTYRNDKRFFIKQNSLAIMGGHHSRAATTLIRNGVSIANSNLYKWVVYLEYDMTTPIKGWKNLIDSKINSLNEQNKKCFYYKQTQPRYKMLWPVVVICDTDIFYKNELLSKVDWISNIREWIRYWGMSVFEYCLETMMKSAFDESLILVEQIEDDANLIWGKNYDVITRSHLPNAKSNYKSISVSHSVWLLPMKDENDLYKLYLYIASDNTFETIKDFILTIDNQIVLKSDTTLIEPDKFDLIEINLNQNKHEKINMSYNLIKEGVPKLYQIDINTRDIEQIHKYIGSIQLRK